MAADSKPEITADQFTVGWICALTVELTAASICLDEKYDKLQDKPANDDNAYTLGRIGKHNVVLAVGPKGEYGVASAAGIARNLVHAFPNVRIGLLVGIGGGAPSPQRDIRLGDVVVSTPGHGFGGVFQYDFGKTIQNAAFQNTSALNQAPTFLRTAISEMETTYNLVGNTIQQDIEKKVNKWGPRVQRMFRRPPLEHDRLYRSDFIHAGEDHEACDDVCGKDPKHLQHRRPRTEDDDDPGIHYGLVASANQLMKDAVLRDKLAKEKDVLCFEMEAAGLVNHFPCLVIRGICDYADTHKNDVFHPYAAITAAVYARDLLLAISSQQVHENERIFTKIEALISQTTQLRETMISKTTQLHETSKQTALTLGGMKRLQDLTGLLSWLEPGDASAALNSARGKRHAGTCKWLLESDRYQTWRQRPGGLLWLIGRPGAGKTVLSSAVIDDLISMTESACPVLYFFFTSTDSSRRSKDHMLRSLVYQIYCKVEAARPCLDKLHREDSFDGSIRPSTEQLMDVLKAMIRTTEGTYIIIDALDECDIRPEVLEIIKRMHQWTGSPLRLLATSRYEQEIRVVLDGFLHPDHWLQIQSKEVDYDIRNFIRSVIHNDEALAGRWKIPGVQHDIENKIMQRTNGMFRWAACQIDAVKQCVDLPMLSETLASLPETLEGTYYQILESIPKKYFRRAVTVLQFLAFGPQRMSLREATDAIALAANEEGDFRAEYRIPNPHDVLNLCGSLIFVDGQIVQLAHSSVQDYLLSGRLIDPMRIEFTPLRAYAQLSKMCIRYIRSLPISWTEPHRVLEEYFLTDKAAKFWTLFVRKVEADDSSVVEMTLDFLVQESERIDFLLLVDKLGQPNRWTRLRKFLPEKARAQLRPSPTLSGVKALVFAAGYGFTSCVLGLIAADSGNGKFHRELVEAFAQACIHSHQKTAEAMLAAVPALKSDKQALSHALARTASHGSEDMMHLLIRNGADANSVGYEDQLPLHSASSAGRHDIVSMLLESGADVNGKSGEVQETAVVAASRNGHQTIVELLLSHGADVHIRVDSIGDALQAACGRGHLTIAQLLLQRKANVNSNGRLGDGTPLLEAVRAGDHEIMKLLLEHGADPNVRTSEKGRTPILNACETCTLQSVDLLIQHKADPSLRDADGATVVHRAAWYGKVELLDRFLSLGLDGCDIQSVTATGDTPLHLAAAWARSDALLYLLGRGARIDVINLDGRTPLHEAVRFASLTEARLLLARGAKRDLKDASGRAPLDYASDNHMTPKFVQLFSEDAKLSDDSSLPGLMTDAA